MNSEADSSREQREKYLPLLNPLAVQTFEIEEAIAILETISCHSAAIARENYDKFFGPVVSTTIDSLLLALARLFERDHPRFKLNSIPTVLAELSADDEKYLPIYEDRWMLVCRSVRDTYCKDALSGDERNIDDVLKRFSAMLEPGGELAGSYDEIRAALTSIRNKRLAHAERIERSELPAITWGHVHKLRDFARCVVAVMSYLLTGDSHIVNGNEYVATNQVATTRVCLERLLTAAGVITEADQTT